MRRYGPDHRIPTPVLGAIAVVLFLAGVYGAFTKRVPFVEGYRVKAVLHSSNELRKGSPVRIAGVDVAKVVDLDHGPGTTAIITMEFKDRGRPVHTDAELRIRPRLFLEGGFYVELSPGSPSAPEMRDGGTIPLSATKLPVQFDQILSGAFDRPSRDALADVLDEAGTALADGGARDLGRSFRPAVPALRDIAIVSKAARGERTHDLSTTIRSLSRITGALAANEDALGGLVTGFARTSGALAAESRALGEGIRELDTVLTTAPPALRAIDRALPPTGRLAQDLRPGLRVAPPVLRGTVRLLDQLERATRPAELPGLIATLRPALTELPRLTDRLQTLFPLVTPVSDCVRERVTPVLETKLDDGALSSGRPLWQDLVHAMVGLNSAASTFDGNGHQVRYLAGIGDQVIGSGDIPGLGPLLGVGPEPIQGVRPRWNGPGKFPPFRPDLPCRDQPAPDLRAPASAPTAMTARSATAAELRRAAAARRATRRATPTQLRRTEQRLRRAAQTRREAGR
ncbi:MlaD family protein [Conexibacter sp. W3-3-2]|uniref:MlaD family protein n=1 Tax=Conexibacter sp. W3-3-2 TaxID=2675227 RepID=UPI0018AB7F2D|nr:MlaD family protein [Conexibacter sp. W3-3-2]